MDHAPPQALNSGQYQRPPSLMSIKNADISSDCEHQEPLMMLSLQLSKFRSSNMVDNAQILRVYFCLPTFGSFYRYTLVNIPYVGVSGDGWMMHLESTMNWAFTSCFNRRRAFSVWQEIAVVFALCHLPCYIISRKSSPSVPTMHRESKQSTRPNTLARICLAVFVLKLVSLCPSAVVQELYFMGFIRLDGLCSSMC